MSLKILSILVSMICYWNIPDQPNQSGNPKTTGIYWTLMMDSPPMNMVLVFDNSKVSQYFEYGRNFGEKAIDRKEYNPEEGTSYVLEEGVLKFHTSKGENRFEFDRGLLKSIMLDGNEKELVFTFKEY